MQHEWGFFMELKDIYKWIREYTWGIDISNIEWLLLDNSEMLNFFHDNYLDFNTWNYATDDLLDHKPGGLHYLSFDRDCVNMKHLIGVCKNMINKKTIIACITYVDDYRIFSDQGKPITYLITAEVNKYFRNKGLSKVLFDEFARIVNPDLHFLSTPESDMGTTCHVFETLRRSLLDNGFDKSITIDDHSDYIYSKEYHDIICEGMQLKKK